MPWLKSFCASGLHEVSKLTVPSLSSFACACASEMPAESVAAIARVVLIALLPVEFVHRKKSRIPHFTTEA